MASEELKEALSELIRLDIELARVEMCLQNLRTERAEAAKKFVQIRDEERPQPAMDVT